MREKIEKTVREYVNDQLNDRKDVIRAKVIDRIGDDLPEHAGIGDVYQIVDGEIDRIKKAIAVP